MTSVDTTAPIFVHGPTNAEDLVRLPGTPWVIASHWNMDVTSGMPPTRYGFGPLKAIRIDTHEVSRLYPSAESAVDWDRETYPDCREPPQSLSSHGLNVRPLGGDKFRLYVANHGDRHSVEIVDVLADGVRLRATWRGGVVAPLQEMGVWPNGVAPLPGEGLILSGFNVAMWRPGSGWEKFGSYEGGRPGESPQPGAVPAGMSNGIEVSPDGQWVFIADSRRRTVIRAPMRGGKQTVIQLGFMPDNLRWGEDGLLYAAGLILPKFETPAQLWALFEQSRPVTSIHAISIHPETLAVKEVLNSEDGLGGRYGMASTALQIGDELWVGSEKTEYIAILKLTR
jgi:hypothetical protein